MPRLCASTGGRPASGKRRKHPRLLRGPFLRSCASTARPLSWPPQRRTARRGHAMSELAAALQAAAHKPHFPTVRQQAGASAEAKLRDHQSYLAYLVRTAPL